MVIPRYIFKLSSEALLFFSDVAKREKEEEILSKGFTGNKQKSKINLGISTTQTIFF
jgi:hypothetical protein